MTKQGSSKAFDIQNTQTPSAQTHLGHSCFKYLLVFKSHGPRQSND